MISEWLTFFLSMLCCQCMEGMQALSNSSARDSISCYRMLSYRTGFLEAGESNRRVPYSDTEVQLRNHNQETSQEELEITDSGDTTGPSIYIEQACGEPRGQQLMVDFSPQTGDGEVELRNQIYDLDSSSIEVTSESEPGLLQARGDHKSRAHYRASRYMNGSETEVVIKTHYPEYESSTTVSQSHDAMSIHNESDQTGKDSELRGQPQSSPELNVTSNQPVVALAAAKQLLLKDLPSKCNQPSISDQIWEFQSCFSSPMSGFRQTDPLWKSYKPDKSSIQNDSEVELKSHLYTTFVSNSAEDVVIVQKEAEQSTLMKVSSPAPKGLRSPDLGNNFPAIHNVSNKARV